jgi:hypothetical protein
LRYRRPAPSRPRIQHLYRRQRQRKAGIASGVDAGQFANPVEAEIHRVGVQIEMARGKAEFGFDKHSMVFRMTIERLDPNRQVIWDCHGDNPEWVGTTLTWTISPSEDGSLLRFTQSGWKDMTDMVATCNSTWGELMYRLKDYVEGKNPGPHWRQ